MDHNATLSNISTFLPTDPFKGHYSVDPPWFRAVGTACTVITITFNSVLIYLMIYRTPKSLQSYANVLFAHCVSDLLYEAVFFYTSVRCIPLNGQFYFIVGGYFHPSSDLDAQRQVLAYFFVSVFIPIALVTLDFVARYRVICLQLPFSRKHVALYALVGYVLSFGYMFLFSVPGYECLRYGRLVSEAERRYLTDTFDFEGRDPRFAIMSILNPKEASLLGVVNAIIVVDYVIIVMITVRIYRRVQCQTLCDTKTRKVNMQVLGVMLAQAFAPSLLFVPTLICITSVFLHADLHTLYHQASCFFLSAFRPAATILLVPSYRRAVFGCIRLQRRDTRSTAVSTSDRETTLHHTVFRILRRENKV